VSAAPSQDPRDPYQTTAGSTRADAKANGERHKYYKPEFEQVIHEYLTLEDTKERKEFVRRRHELANMLMEVRMSALWHRAQCGAERTPGRQGTSSKTMRGPNNATTTST
jgi:hypothetical protein